MDEQTDEQAAQVEFKLEEYLEAIELTKIVRERIRSIIEFYTGLFTEPIELVFVNDIVNDEGQYIHDSLWVFTERWTFEAKNFLSEDNFDGAFIKDSISHWVVKKQDYEPDRAVTKSRMTLTFGTVHGINGQMKASSRNCDFLFSVLENIIIPNMVSSPIPAVTHDTLTESPPDRRERRALRRPRTAAEGGRPQAGS